MVHHQFKNEIHIACYGTFDTSLFKLEGKYILNNEEPYSSIVSL